MGEVDQKLTDPGEGVFQFPLVNDTRQPVQIGIRSIGCSCYSVMRGETRLKVGDQFELGAGQTETLTLRPPRPTVDRASDYVFSVEYEPSPATAKRVIACQATLVTMSEFRVNPSFLSAEFTKDSKPEILRFEIARTARDANTAESPLHLIGWPEGTKVDGPTPAGPAAEIGPQLWRKGWSVKATIPRPDPSTGGADDFRTIRVSSGDPGSPTAEAKLIVRYRSGISGPQLVHFGDVPVGKSVTRRIQILSRDGQTFRILGPSEPGHPLSIQPESSSPVNTHWGILTFTPDQAGEFQDSLLVSTDHPEQPALKIEVRAHVTPAEG